TGSCFIAYANFPLNVDLALCNLLAILRYGANSAPMKHSFLSLFSFTAVMLLVIACDDDDDSRARKLASGNIETLAGSGPDNFGYDGDNGQATSAKLGWITSVVVDASNNFYVTDGAANVVRKIAADGIITTIAGTFIGFNQINNT